ncbi:hypothetical protein E3N88_09441 [Mikania micrantha]|uniref:Uncharacterized protein n=1 Tax=Mikania micrantha TaxID=192012 RepID=A0A5N6PM52_9ASTR|nr:hypothetical protein E3N88_09441 [Mikania micrantha]
MEEKGWQMNREKSMGKGGSPKPQVTPPGTKATPSPLLKALGGSGVGTLAAVGSGWSASPPPSSSPADREGNEETCKWLLISEWSDSDWRNEGTGYSNNSVSHLTISTLDD